MVTVDSARLLVIPIFEEALHIDRRASPEANRILGDPLSKGLDLWLTIKNQRSKPKKLAALL